MTARRSDGIDEEPFDLDDDVGGLPPQTVKLIAGAVIALAAVGIIAAMALRSSSKEKEAKRREAEFLRKGVGLTYEAAQMAVDYFSSGQQTIPPEFYTRFHEDRLIVDVVIQQQPSGSVTFHPVAFALQRKVDSLGERPKYNPQPIQGTEVYDTKGTAVINMVEYPIRVFRQNIKDEKGRVLGRVAVMLFEPGRTD
jgi:hypothetical protein